MKKRLLVIGFLFCCSCAYRKLQRPTTMVDLKTGTHLKVHSLMPERGKICYIFTARYDNELLGPSIFTNGDTADFYAPGASFHSAFGGGSYRSKKVDTVVHNNFLVQVALQEALHHCPLGFQYQFVPQQAFVLKNEIDTAKLHQFNPDIIVNLKSLSLQMKGSVHNNGTSLTQTTGVVNICCYSITEPVSNSYGEVLMDYTAVWEVWNIAAHSQRTIKQEGRFVSPYHGRYEMNKEAMSCAKKIGEEFSSLFENSYPHYF